MDVIYASDENYVRHAAASIYTLLRSNAHVPDLTVHFLSLGVTDDSRRKLEQMIARFGRRLEMHELGDIRSWFGYSVDTGGFAYATLARLFLGRILPESVERVLYIDCDTVVLEDLSELFTLDMGKCVAGMVMEPTVNKARRKQLGLPDSQPYDNAGILLIDLKRWRAEGAEQTIIDYFGAHGGKLMAPDQDALNGALQDRILQLPPRYNYGSVQIYYSWKAQRRIAAPTPFMTEDAYRKGTEKPAIIHFLGEERPWRKGCRHPYTRCYDEALAATAWAGHPKDEGWTTYFHCFYLFNFLMKPFPVLRWRIIDGLIPVFMRHRARQLKKKEAAKAPRS